MDLAGRTLSGVKSFVADIMGESAAGSRDNGATLAEGRGGERRVYSIGFLKAIKYSTLAVPPEALPALKDWFGEEELPPPQQQQQLAPATSGLKQHAPRASHEIINDRSKHNLGDALEDGGERFGSRRRERDTAGSSSFSPSKDSFINAHHARDKHNGLPQRRFDDHADATGPLSRTKTAGGRETRDKDNQRPRAWHDKSHPDESDKSDRKSGHFQSDGPNWRESTGGRSEGRDWVQAKGNDHRRDRNLDATRSATFTNKFGRLGEQDHETPAWMDNGDHSPPKSRAHQNNRNNRYRDYEAEEDARDAETFGSLDDATFGAGNMDDVPDLAHWSHNGVDEMQAFKEKMKREQAMRTGVKLDTRPAPVKTADQEPSRPHDEIDQPLTKVSDNNPEPSTKIVEVPTVRSSRFAKYFSGKPAEEAGQTVGDPPTRPDLSKESSGSSDPRLAPPGLESLMAKVGTQDSKQDQDMLRVMAMLGGSKLDPAPTSTALQPSQPPPSLAQAKSQKQSTQNSQAGAVPATATATSSTTKQRSRFFGGDVPTAVLRAGKSKTEKERGASGSPGASRAASPAPSSAPSIPAVNSSAPLNDAKAATSYVEPTSSGAPPPGSWTLASSQASQRSQNSSMPPDLRLQYPAEKTGVGNYPLMSAPGAAPQHVPYNHYPHQGPPPQPIMYGPQAQGPPFMRGPPPPLPPPGYALSSSNGPVAMGQHYMPGPAPTIRQPPQYTIQGRGPPPGLEPFGHVASMQSPPNMSSLASSYDRSLAAPAVPRDGHLHPRVQQTGFVERSQPPPTVRQQHQAPPSTASGQPDLMRLLLGGER